MKRFFILICFTIGILNGCASEINKPSKITTTKQIADDTTTNAAAVAESAPVVAITLTNESTKDKRQTKDTKVATNDYANHRSDTASAIVHRNSNTNSDDPEDPQETVYGTNARQFLIRPQQQQQHLSQHHQQQQQQQQNEEEQLPPQLRNYPATIRPHNTQLLEQSQEIQHFAYLQDLSQNQHKTQGKSQTVQNKKPATASLRDQNGQVEETEQRYAVAVEQPIPQLPRALPYRQQNLYQQQQHQLQQQQQQQHQQNSNQAQYQIIPEEQFLKILEEELQARAYHEDQIRRHQVVQEQNPQRQQQNYQRHQQHQHHQQQQQQQQQQEQQSAAAVAASQKVALQAQGLGNYRQRPEAEEDGQQEYVQYVQRPRGGPKYLPLSQGAQHQEQSEQELSALPQLPSQIAYYQPQISYKTLPNHPLAKSSLEKEIEMLFESNKPNVAPVQIVDNSNEPSALINHHQRAPAPPQPLARTPKAYIPSTAAPNSLVDGNNQPFVPSMFRFGNYPQPTQNYPAQQVSQQVIDAKKLGPVVYPPQTQGVPIPSHQPPVQASQFYYQDAAPSPSPSPRPKAYRSKYGTKFATTPTPLRNRQNEINYPGHNKFAQSFYDIERPAPSNAAGSPTHFYPSPNDPHRNIPPTAQPTPSVAGKYTAPQNDFRQFALPGPSSSQSSIYVSQGTGIATPSHPISTVKPKTMEDIKQLHLPRPGGKPLTQAEFQSLVDAGYPVTAVPVPVPVPYEQYVRDHPEYRNQPPPQPPALPVNYEHLMRFAQLQQHHQVPQYGPQRPTHPRALVGRPSEPSVKIVSSPSEPQSATALGGGSVTYLRAIPENQKRRPRDETESKVLGAKEEPKHEVETKQIEEKKEK